MQMRERLEAAWLVAHPYPEMGDAIDRFTRLLDAEAWLDAAMMLVPEGWRVSLETLADESVAHLWAYGPTRSSGSIFAPTPAEALLAAIEKART